MTTLNYQISNGGDDGVTYSSGYTNYWASHRVGKYYTYGYDLAVRFRAVTIPDGATITAAYLSFYYKGSYSGTPRPVTIYAELAANPSAPTSNSDYAAKSRTTAHISFTPTASGTWMNTGDMSELVTELMDNYSFASGSAMQFLLDKGALDGYVEIYSYEGDAAKAPKLTIEYTEAAAGGKVNLIGPGLIGQSPLINRSPLLSW